MQIEHPYGKDSNIKDLMDYPQYTYRIEMLRNIVHGQVVILK